jgi:hypothetical protein
MKIVPIAMAIVFAPCTNNGALHDCINLLKRSCAFDEIVYFLKENDGVRCILMIHVGDL